MLNWPCVDENLVGILMSKVCSHVFDVLSHFVTDNGICVTIE